MTPLEAAVARRRRDHVGVFAVLGLVTMVAAFATMSATGDPSPGWILTSFCGLAVFAIAMVRAMVALLA